MEVLEGGDWRFYDILLEVQHLLRTCKRVCYLLLLYNLFVFILLFLFLFLFLFFIFITILIILLFSDFHFFLIRRWIIPL